MSNIQASKHYPPSILEWNNSIHSFNKKGNPLLPVMDNNVHSLLDSYFNLNIKQYNSISLLRKNKIKKPLLSATTKKRLSMIKLFVRKPKIKHTNNKVIISIYTFNRKKIFYLNKIKKFLKLFKTNLIPRRFARRRALAPPFNLNGKSSAHSRQPLERKRAKIRFLPFAFNISLNKKKYFITKFINSLTHVDITKRTSLFKNCLTKILFKHKKLHGRFSNLLRKTEYKKASARFSAAANYREFKSKHKNKLSALRANIRAKFLQIKRKKKLLLNVIRNKSISIFFTYLKKYTTCKEKKSFSLRSGSGLKYRQSGSGLKDRQSGSVSDSLKGNKSVASRGRVSERSPPRPLVCSKRNFLVSGRGSGNEIKKLASKRLDAWKEKFSLLSGSPTLNFQNILKYKNYCSMLYFNSYLFNSNNLLALKNILKNIYSKKIEFNIINLKYLYLDSNILAQAITRKLKDRQKRVLRVLKLSLKLAKNPYFKIHFYKDKYRTQCLSLNYSSSHLSKGKGLCAGRENDMRTKHSRVGTWNDKLKNKHLVDKPSTHKIRLFLYHMKQKIVTGIRLQGSGRLTKRLTASRSISKVKCMGSLKNINSSYQSIPTVMLRGFVKSNLESENINDYNQNGSFGINVSVSVH